MGLSTEGWRQGRGRASGEQMNSPEPSIFLRSQHEATGLRSRPGRQPRQHRKKKFFGQARKLKQLLRFTTKA
jgi:hypothetical protein